MKNLLLLFLLLVSTATLAQGTFLDTWYTSNIGSREIQIKYDSKSNQILTTQDHPDYRDQLIHGSERLYGWSFLRTKNGADYYGYHVYRGSRNTRINETVAVYFDKIVISNMYATREYKR